MDKVYVAGPEVVVILRHDPASSDPVEVSSVLAANFFGEGLDYDLVIDLAEDWAKDREIEFIRQDAEEGAYDESGGKEWAAKLNRTNLTRLTDLWFEPVIMPVTEDIKIQVAQNAWRRSDDYNGR